MASIVSNRGRTMNHSLKEQLTSAFDEIQVDVSEENRMVITTRKEAVLSVLNFLKNHGYNHLGLISCVDWIEEKAFELVYILSAYMQEDEKYTDNEKNNIILKAKISRVKSKSLSVMPIFNNAEPYDYNRPAICGDGQGRRGPPQRVPGLVRDGADRAAPRRRHRLQGS